MTCLASPHRYCAPLPSPQVRFLSSPASTRRRPSFGLLRHAHRRVVPSSLRASHPSRPSITTGRDAELPWTRPRGAAAGMSSADKADGGEGKRGPLLPKMPRDSHGRQQGCGTDARGGEEGGHGKEGEHRRCGTAAERCGTREAVGRGCRRRGLPAAAGGASPRTSLTPPPAFSPPSFRLVASGATVDRGKVARAQGGEGRGVGGAPPLTAAAPPLTRGRREWTAPLGRLQGEQPWGM